MQLHKSVYFPKEHTKSDNSECVRLAFNPDKDRGLYAEVTNLRSSELRQLLGNPSYEDLVKGAENERRSLNNYCTNILRKKQDWVKKTYGEQAGFSQALTSTLFSQEIDPLGGTFKIAKTEKIHRWYPYIEGYSCLFVNQIIDSLPFKPRHIYDPLSGSGTTQIAASHLGILSSYSEINPFMQFVIDTKVNIVIELKRDWPSNKLQLQRFIRKLDDLHTDNVSLNDYSAAFNNRNYFRTDVIKTLLTIRNLIDDWSSDSQRKLLTLALSSIAVEVSNMIRRADLRYKTEKELQKTNFDTLSVFKEKVLEMMNDLDGFSDRNLAPAVLYSENAKDASPPIRDKYDLVVTSPPYVNGTNYFRNSKIELWLTGFINSEKELKKYRQEAIVSGINNVSNSLERPAEIKGVEKVAKRLEETAYDPRIPKLIKHYFSDMRKVFSNIRGNLTDYGKVFIDIGDSQFAGVHIPTDEFLINIAKDEGLELDDKRFIRERYSRGGARLKEVLLVFGKSQKDKRKLTTRVGTTTPADLVVKNYSEFKNELPYRLHPFSKRNWGHPLHSLCSYQGKLKPSIAHFLVAMFTRPGMRVLDPLGGVGTIPFEACLNGRVGISNDISLLAHANALAKLKKINSALVDKELAELHNYIRDNLPTDGEVESVDVAFNKSIKDYYHPGTFKEILAARKYFLTIDTLTPEQALILASLSHILHGNRPYALSRRSHSITPFAPRGEFEYKSVIEKTKEKVHRMLTPEYPEIFAEGESLNFDYSHMDQAVEGRSIDAVITSPPFYSSTKFYLSNWIRMWFCGWDKEDFDTKKDNYLETRQLENFNVYKDFFHVMDKALKPNGIIVMHLGRSGRFNMGKELMEIAKDKFEVYGLADESVSHLEKFGVADQGGTQGHQYLFLIKGS